MAGRYRILQGFIVIVAFLFIEMVCTITACGVVYQHMWSLPQVGLLVLAVVSLSSTYSQRNRVTDQLFD